MTTRIRADYEQLAAIARAFGQQAETAQSLLDGLQRSMQPLQAGDWVGKGADRFYAEMTSTVLPAMQRVVAAMTEAAGTTTAIGRVMKQAEADSAALFRLDGSGGASGERVAQGPVVLSAGPASAFTGDASAAGGTGGPAPKNKPGWRMPPGSETYTPAEYEAWKKRHPNHAQESVIGKHWKEEYKPEWLQARGYRYAGWRGTSFSGVEIWLSDKGNGKELLIARDNWTTGPADESIAPARLHEHVQEAEDYIQDATDKFGRLTGLARDAYAAQDTPDYEGRVADFRQLEKRYRENLAADMERVRKLMTLHDRAPDIRQQLKDRLETLQDMSNVFWAF